MPDYIPQLSLRLTALPHAMEAVKCYCQSSRKVTSKQYNKTQQTDILATQQQRFRVSKVVALESVMTANNCTAVSAGEQSKCN
jgi:hypothetical protein